MKFGNKMLKPVIRKYNIATRIVNMNENLEFRQFFWPKTGCNQERMLINYGGKPASAIIKGTAMQTGKALINDRLCVTKVS